MQIENNLQITNLFFILDLCLCTDILEDSLVNKQFRYIYVKIIILKNSINPRFFLKKIKNSGFDFSKKIVYFLILLFSLHTLGLTPFSRNGTRIPERKSPMFKCVCYQTISVYWSKPE